MIYQTPILYLIGMATYLYSEIESHIKIYDRRLPYQKPELSLI